MIATYFPMYVQLLLKVSGISKNIKKNYLKYFIIKNLTILDIIYQNLILFNALFLNKFASLIYLLTISVDLLPVIAIILLSSAPDSAVEVAKPDLKLCPAYL